jgi:hypothetical protein
MIAAVVGQAIRGRTYALTDEDGATRDVFVGGLPDFVYCDNESKLHARTLNALYAGIGVNVLPINSYSSHENGVHERLHGTLRTQVLDLLPGSSRAPLDHRGHSMSNGDGTVPDITTARDLLRAFAYKWNTEIATDGPALERWVEALDAGHAVRQAMPHELAPLALEHTESCQRYSLGVRLLNEHYFCPELTKQASKRFTVRRWLGDADHVEIFTVDGTYVGTAVRNGAQTAAESQAIVTHNADERRVVEEVHHKADPVRAQLVQDIAASAPQTTVLHTFHVPSRAEEDPDQVIADASLPSTHSPGRDLSDALPAQRAPEPDPIESLAMPVRRHDPGAASDDTDGAQ